MTQSVVLHSPAVVRAYEMCARIAPFDVPVLLVGETGTGKELFAEALHRMSARSHAPMRTVNCGAIPDEIMQSVLFGHERGSFTGAHGKTRGLFEQASGGTLFLDEVGELSMSVQPALLRVLETGQIQKVGAEQSDRVDVRVVAATHRNLEAMVEQGTFRRDLLYRLNTVTLRVPSLRERPEDIEPLVHHFVATLGAELGRRVQPPDSRLIERLRRYDWPGNVRQLRNAIQRALVVSKGDTIQIEDFPTMLAEDDVADEQHRSSISSGPSVRLRDALRAYERELIARALEHTGGNQRRAAELLDVPRRTLVRKLRDFAACERARPKPS